jgi:hypothetical protein
MFFSLSHIEIPVDNLNEGAILYKNSFDLEIHSEYPDYIDLELGFIKFRVIEKINKKHISFLRFEVPSLDECYKKLIDLGFKCILEPYRKNNKELESRLIDPYNNIISLWRELTEDELDTPPVLNTNKQWDKEANEVLQTLLKNVPFMFRKLARERSVKESEALSINNIVDVRTAIRGYITATPDIMKERVKKHISEIGFSPNDFLEDFI